MSDCTCTVYIAPDAEHLVGCPAWCSGSPPTRSVIQEHFAAKLLAINTAAEAEGRRTMAMAAHFFACARADRHRLDLRRLGDRYAEAACRRSVARSEALEAARLARAMSNGRVVYEAHERPAA